jgi:hypothetical protein
MRREQGFIGGVTGARRLTQDGTSVNANHWHRGTGFSLSFLILPNPASDSP